MDETWKEFADGYEVSNRGEVRSWWKRGPGGKRSTPRMMTPCPDGQAEYMRVTCKVLGSVRVHQLVAKTFLGPCPAGFEIDHIDRCRHNNRLDNLRYISREENLARRLMPSQAGASNHNAALSEEQVRSIKDMLAAGNLTQKCIAHAYGVSKTCIKSIASGRNWSRIPARNA